MQDKGFKIGAQRALDAFARARGPFYDRQTALIYLLDSLERDWADMRARDIRQGVDPDLIPDFGMLARAASRLASL